VKAGVPNTGFDMAYRLLDLPSELNFPLRWRLTANFNTHVLIPSGAAKVFACVSGKDFLFERR
jgi:hypothetical protein